MIDKKKTCCFSGHRILPSNFDCEELKKLVYKSINDGFDTFLCGMALGFDSECFKVLQELKKDFTLKVIACIPCESQSKFFNKKQKAEYEKMINSADEVIYVSKEYFDGCMQKRNRHLVDGSSLCVCYLAKQDGGTAYTVQYAREKGLQVVNIAE